MRTAASARDELAADSGYLLFRVMVTGLIVGGMQSNRSGVTPNIVASTKRGSAFSDATRPMSSLGSSALVLKR